MGPFFGGGGIVGLREDGEGEGVGEEKDILRGGWRDASHRRASHGVSFVGVPLIGVRLIDECVMGVHLAECASDGRISYGRAPH